MLEYLRNAADKPVAKFLMFILIFSFVGWGAADWIFGGSMRDTTLISVGDADITTQQFTNERSRQLSSMTKEEQRAVYTDPVKGAALTDAVMASLTTNQLALNRAKDLGFVVSEKRIADEIKAQPQFQINGNFVPWMFDMVMQNSGLTEKEISNVLRADIMRQMLVGAVSVPVVVPEFAVDAMYNVRYGKRGIDYSTIKFAGFKVDNPTEEQLKTYYAQNPIVVPEVRSVSYVFVPADTSKPDSYDEGYALMQQVEDMIMAGDSMKEAADKYKADFVQVARVARGVKSGDKILNNDLVEKIFSMESGKESELIDLKDGFVILRVDDIIAAHNAEFDDVKKSLVADWKKSEQRKQAYVAANEQLVALNNGDTTNLKKMKNVSVSRTEGAPLVVLNSAFAGAKGTNALVEDTDAFYVVHVNDVVMPKVDKAKKESLRKELEKMSKHYVVEDYTKFLRREYPVKVNKKAYDKYIAK